MELASSDGAWAAQWASLRTPGLPHSPATRARPTPDRQLIVRVTASPDLVVAAHWDLARAPRLKRAYQYGRRERRADEHELLKQPSLDRPKSAEHRDQKRNWQDRRHSLEALERQAQSLVASHVENAAARFQFPRQTTTREFVKSSAR